jgi:adenylylsulfate kinase-like enzyme
VKGNIMDGKSTHVKKGTLYWVTGLSGAGKSTFGRILYQKIREKKETVIFLDGDEVRTGLCDDLGYDASDRKICALRYSKLSELLVNQGFDVVFCTISMFDEVRQRNRDKIENYVEIYIKTPLKTLFERNQKKMYSDSSPERKLVGVDIEAEEPKNPDYIIETENMSVLNDYAREIADFQE